MFNQSILIRSFLLTVTAGLLVFISAGKVFQPWRDRVLGSMAPAFGAVRSGLSAAGGVFAGSEKKIRALEEERLRLLAEVSRRDDLVSENETLRKTLELRSEGEASAIPARSVAFFREGRDEYLLLDRGIRDGITVGDKVISRNHVLAGIVIATGAHSAKVILLSSPSRSIDVIVSGKEIRAIARGNNARDLIIDLVPQDADIHVGDLLIASGRATGGRRAVLVGEVRAVTDTESGVFKGVRAVHLFDPTDEDVIVLTEEKP